MQALILAAGRGSRLGQKSDGIPKCLLEVGRRPLIEHQLETLANAGVGPVGMVVGYCADEIRQVIGIRAEYILNPRWSATNSLYSFWLAREWVQGPAIVLNSDILFHPDIIEKLLASKADAIAYDSSSGDGLEHMKVHVHEGKLREMRKDLPAAMVSGENVGILHLTAPTAQALFRRAGEIIQAGGEKHWLGAAVCEIAKEREIQGIDVAGLHWGEVDFPYDLDRLRKEVWPAIQRDVRTNKRPWRWTRWAAAFAGAFALTVLLMRSSVTPLAVARETLEMVEVEKVELMSDNRVQTWWLIEPSRKALLRLKGPMMLEIETRVVIPHGQTNETPYVLDISLDGKSVDWFKESARPSETWDARGFAVGKHRKLRCAIPAGAHEVQIGLIAAQAGKCLVRAQLETTNQETD